MPTCTSYILLSVVIKLVQNSEISTCLSPGTTTKLLAISAIDSLHIVLVHVVSQSEIIRKMTTSLTDMASIISSPGITH
jgi:hypothetical protein